MTDADYIWILSHVINYTLNTEKFYRNKAIYQSLSLGQKIKRMRKFTLLPNMRLSKRTNIIPPSELATFIDQYCLDRAVFKFTIGTGNCLSRLSEPLMATPQNRCLISLRLQLVIWDHNEIIHQLPLQAEMPKQIPEEVVESTLWLNGKE